MFAAAVDSFSSSFSSGRLLSCCTIRGVVSMAFALSMSTLTGSLKGWRWWVDGGEVVEEGRSASRDGMKYPAFPKAELTSHSVSLLVW